MVAEVLSSAGEASSAGTWRGRGRTKEGWRFAVETSALKVLVGREKWMLCGLEAWRRRQRVSISLLGRVEIFSRSRKEFNVLTPGGGGLVPVGSGWGVGGGGGAGHGDFVGGDCDALDEVDVGLGEGDSDSEDGGVGGGANGAVAPGTAASFLNFSIFSLYASLSSATSFKPFSFALDSSLSLYFASMRSCVSCVAR